MSCINARTVLLIYIFLGMMTLYMLRVNISVAILEMRLERDPAINDCGDNATTNGTSNNSTTDGAGNNATTDTTNNNATSNNATNTTETFDWSDPDCGIILGSYYIGYFITQKVTCQYMCCGPKNAAGLFMLLSAILTLLLPIVANLHLGMVIAVRLVVGLFSGPMLFAFQSLIEKWAPPEERARFICALFGGLAGILVTWPCCGLITYFIGWSFVFYITGGLACLWSVLWLVFINDSPSNHPRISESEKQFILTSINKVVPPRNQKPPVPWSHALCSCKYLVLILVHFCSMWGFGFALIEGPIIMSDVLGWSILLGSILAVVPFLARMLFGLLFSCCGNYLHRNNKMNPTVLRKLFTAVSHLLPGILYVVIFFIMCSRVIVLLLFILAFALNGASVAGSLANPHDMSPHHGGRLYSCMHWLGSISWILVPILIGVFTNGEDRLEKWGWMFLVCGVIQLVGGLLFILLGSAMIRPWNYLGVESWESERTIPYAPYQPLYPLTLEAQAVRERNYIPGSANTRV